MLFLYYCNTDINRVSAGLKTVLHNLKGVVDWFFSRLDCVYGVMIVFFKNALFFT